MDLPQRIRIIELLPGQYDDDIECVLRSVRLRSQEQYEALSYVWGDTSNPKCIQVSGKRVLVTRALFAILKRLRDETEIRALWIDQLCIRQWDQDDKMHQIGLMRDIFSRCMRCLVWVGEVDDGGQITLRDAEAALEFISLCAGYPRWALAHPNHRESNGPKTQESMYHQPDFSIPISLSSPEKVAGAVRAFQRFTAQCSIWWSRVWTVQEVVLPEKALVQWGPLSLPWSIITRAALNLCNPGTKLPSLSLLQAFDGLLDDFFGPVRGLSKAKEGEGPLNILQRWRYREATDPRDKVYALMGLFPSGTLPSVLPSDYRLSILALYPKVTADLVHVEQGLRPLVGLRGRYTPGLATWAIDLVGSPDLETWRWWWNHSHRYKWFQADDGGALSGRFLHDDFTLSLTGVPVDTVAKAGKVLRVHRGQTPSNTEIIETIQSWRQLTVEYMGQYHHLEGCPYDNWDAVFWTTMIGDLIMNEYPRRRATLHDAKLVMLYYQSKTWSEVVPSLKNMVINKSFFITQQGYIGLGPPDLENGDHVWVLSGGNVPFILRHRYPSADMRPGQEASTYILIGDAYVHGIMDGEAVKLYGSSRQAIHIV